MKGERGVILLMRQRVVVETYGRYELLHGGFVLTERRVGRAHVCGDFGSVDNGIEGQGKR